MHINNRFSTSSNRKYPLTQSSDRLPEYDLGPAAQCLYYLILLETALMNDTYTTDITMSWPIYLPITRQPMKKTSLIIGIKVRFPTIIYKVMQ